MRAITREGHTCDGWVFVGVDGATEAAFEASMGTYGEFRLATVGSA